MTLRLVSPDPVGATPHELHQRIGAAAVERVEAPNPYEKKSIEELFDMALSGEVPRERPLKQGEPERLSAQHLQWVLMRSMGFRPGQIVELESRAGREVSLPRVSVILHHPDAEFLLARLVSYRAEASMGSVTQRLAQHAHEMISINLHHARNVKKPELSQKTSMELLKLHYANEQKAPPEKQGAELDPAETARLARAIEASKRLRERGYTRYEVQETGAAGGDSLSPAAALGSGSLPQAPAVVSPVESDG